jgi:2-polyprenyl-6-methoxyphenol hydroxylase-like FAD-dependent oxidoreductase
VQARRTPDRQWDVIVVGARVAGAATAMLLARAGLRVLVVERGRQGADTLSTHALMRAGTLQLHKWGLLDDVRAAGAPPVRHIDFFYGDEQVHVSIKPAAGVDALYAPRRTLLDSLLVEEAARSGATIRFGVSVTGLTRDPSGHVVGVLLRDRSGNTATERASVVIGADGRSSTVAAAVGAEALVTGDAAGDYVYGYFAGLPASGFEWLYRPGLAAGVIPTNGGLVCVFAGGPPHRVGAQVRRHGAGGALERLASTVHPGLGDRLRGSRQAESVRYARGRPAHLRQAAGPGWALVGDAGYWKDPISTHGITAALRDAELLARALVAAPDPGPEQAQALGDYQAIRDGLSLSMLDVVERIASYTWGTGQLHRLLRDLASCMTDEIEMLADLPSLANIA